MAHEAYVPRVLEMEEADRVMEGEEARAVQSAKVEFACRRPGLGVSAGLTYVSRRFLIGSTQACVKFSALPESRPCPILHATVRSAYQFLCESGPGLTLWKKLS
jgi:hypothetical protein